MSSNIADTAANAGASKSILVINPNTTKSMTDALRPLIANLSLPTDIQIDYFTAPSEPTTYPDGAVYEGISSINCGEESCRSAMHVFPHVLPLIERYDGFLVACYSAHPLVGMLKERIAELSGSAKRKYVMGIFEASVSTALGLLSHFDIVPAPTPDASAPGKAVTRATFGIISTGSVWEKELTQAVTSMLLKQECPAQPLPIFAGVETTGLSAVELHTTPAEEVERRIVAATERLVAKSGGSVSAICLGCAGMAGMDAIVRRGCKNALGEKADGVVIVDGVLAGVGMLATACKATF